MQQPGRCIEITPPFIAEAHAGGKRRSPFAQWLRAGDHWRGAGTAAPLLHLDAENGLALGAATLAGLFTSAPRCFGYICDKVGRRKMFLLDIIAIN